MKKSIYRFCIRILFKKKDFPTLYNKILTGKVSISDVFPQNRLFRYKKETLELLKEYVENRDGKSVSYLIAILYWDGADQDYTDLLLKLLDEDWHQSEEDIIEVLEIIKDPKSIDKLYEVAINIPDYDEMRAIAKKSIWALGAINTPEAIDKLNLLASMDDWIIKENAIDQLGYIKNRD